MLFNTVSACFVLALSYFMFCYNNNASLSSLSLLFKTASTAQLALMGVAGASGVLSHLTERKTLALSLLALPSLMSVVTKLMNPGHLLLLTALSSVIAAICMTAVWFTKVSVKFAVQVMFAEHYIREFCASCGVTVSPVGYTGPATTYDLVMHKQSVFRQWVFWGNYGIGESYRNGLWDAHDMVATFTKLRRIVNAKPHTYHLYSSPDVYLLGQFFDFFNLQAHWISPFIVNHYEFSNEFYEKVLPDKYMQYTNAYWRGAKNLDEAQEKKLHLIAQKMHLSKGKRVLDIGCGWGGMAGFLAKEYECEVVAVTLSKEQFAYCKEHYKSPLITFVLSDYRDYVVTAPDNSFDAVTNQGFMEHVGVHSYDFLWGQMRRLMKEDSVNVVQVIGHSTSKPVHAYGFIFRYIFPWSQLPSNLDIVVAAEKSGMVIEDWQNRGEDYALTLEAWYEALVKNADEIIKEHGIVEYRNWVFYFLSCAAEFRSRRVHSWQICLSKSGLTGGYYVPLL